MRHPLKWLAAMVRWAGMAMPASPVQAKVPGPNGRIGGASAAPRKFCGHARDAGRPALRSVEQAGGAHAGGDQLLRRAGPTVLEHPDHP